MNRDQFLEKATNQSFDLCIIGGGATGAGCALDAQSRGLKVILIEQEDFGAGTSSKSTKLIHGGVRYLEQAFKKLSAGQFKMVRKALRERKNLLAIAPHITRRLQIITPCRNWIAGMYYAIGLKLYDWISGQENIGRSRLLSRKEALALIPTLKKSELYNAVLYYDGQLDDQRFNLALVQTAVEKGAICLNHCKAVLFEKDLSGRLVSVLTIDQLTGRQIRIRANLFVNACGPYSDAVRIMANAALKPRIRVSRGVHILLPRTMMPTSAALLIPQTKDGRLIFVIPYGGGLLAGTTDDEIALTTKEFGPDAGEVAYLLGYVNKYLDVNATSRDVTAGFGGLRPLIMAAENHTRDLVRDHEIETDPVSGMISILGGKWTTYRLMAMDAIDAAIRQLKMTPVPAVTHKIVLSGSQHFEQGINNKVQELTNCDSDIANHLDGKYGDKAFAIAAIMQKDRSGRKRLVTGLPYTVAELEYVVSAEMAVTVKDVLNRRWGIQLFNWKQTLELIPVVGKWMTAYLNWNEQQQRFYIEAYTKEVKEMMLKI